jgi:hypothetical protein
MCGQGELGSWAYGVREIVADFDGHMQVVQRLVKCLVKRRFKDGSTDSSKNWSKYGGG